MVQWRRSGLGIPHVDHGAFVQKPLDHRTITGERGVMQRGSSRNVSVVNLRAALQEQGDNIPVAFQRGVM